ncbi:putative DNA mismatch repair protein [Shewanella halifaxensis HAW-EB4]|uniref:DNA mismatch repair protein n=1 Tax=Shewanella halifaxensis (strain HAW-EB4) TaxID=458817 RepID=B0TTZ9_SHEHH|nr:ATP-binding protein [Shewanella halifaxensis]ABZ78110.1 putative DNA mismatch repair protein [Shewanella halifaxensis HAW-EB4]
MNQFSVETTNITSSGIKKHFKKYINTPEQVIFELVANGFDAKATTVNVITEGDIGTNQVVVLDNGVGINAEDKHKHFSCFNDSQKANDNNTQGAHGRGRLSFHLICDRADWYSRCNGKDIQISISSDDLVHYNLSRLSTSEQKHELIKSDSGTYVELNRFEKNLPENDKLVSKLQCEFGWRLALNKNLKLFVNDVEVKVPSHKLHTKTFEFEDDKFDISLIRWQQRPGSEKSKFYFVNSDGRVKYSGNTSFNKKSGFYLSTYVQSNWINRFEAVPLTLDFNGNNDGKEPAGPRSKAYSELINHIKMVGLEIYTEFLTAQIDEQIEKYEEDGFFPEYQNLNDIDAKWRRKNLKSIIKEIWLAEPSTFSNLKLKAAKIIISLLDRLIVSNENDSLMSILESVMELDEEKLNRLNNVINKTTLENIVSTIEMLQRREDVVKKLEYLILERYQEVLETPHLQKIIEANTWLFGEQYSLIGAEEDDFQKIAINLREKVSKLDDLNITDLDPIDISEGLQVEGVRRQVDLFLARRKKEYENGKPYFKCTIIEIKRPSVALNKTHLRQLQDYSEIISAHPGFSSQNMRFEFILVGRKVSSSDHGINLAWNSCQSHNETGLVFHAPTMKGYVKTWATITKDFELTNDYLLEKLKTNRDSYENEASKDIISDLQQKSA